MPLTPIDLVFSDILKRIRPSAVPASQRAALNQMAQEVSVFVQQRFPLHHERVGEPVTLGSKEKGTDICLDYDLDVFVPFKYGFRLNPRGMKAAVLKALQERFSAVGCTVSDDRVSIVVRRKGPEGDLVIDVVPGMELEPNLYRDGPGQEDGKFLRVYDRVSNAEQTMNAHRQVRLVKEGMPHYCDSLRLLKAWRQHEDFKVSGFALELMVLNAAMAEGAPKTGPPRVLLGQVIAHAIPLLLRDGALQDRVAGYLWQDFLGPDAKRQLAERWRKLLRLIEKGDHRGLRSFFP